MVTPFSDSELRDALANLPGWRYDAERKAIFRSLTCANFSEAIGVMVRVAFEADRADHHPEWFNVYNRIDIWLTTHDARGVSVRDAALALKINAIAGA